MTETKLDTQNIINRLKTSDLELEDAYKFFCELTKGNLTLEEFSKKFETLDTANEFNLHNYTSKDKLDNLKLDLEKNNINGYIVTTQDEFINEYTPLNARRLHFITGFSGSFGIFIITKRKSALFVDGRYTLQAQNQVDTSLIEVKDLSIKNIHDFICENLKENEALGLTISSTTYTEFKNYENFLTSKNLKLKILEENLVDNIWAEKPMLPLSPVVIYDEKYNGENYNKKLDKIFNNLNNSKLDALIVSLPDNIAWLLNIRGRDIKNIPVSLCYSVIYKDNIEVFIDPLKLTPLVKDYFKDSKVKFIDINELDKKLDSLKNLKIGFNLDSPYYFYHKLNQNNTLSTSTDFITNLKCLKNDVEIKNSILAHKKDAAALVKLIKYIEENYKSNTLDELSINKKLFDLKKEQENFKGISFESIIGVRENSAIIHYKSTKETNKVLKENSNILMDTGSQFLEGTTDITRTLFLGSPPLEYKTHYTLVLKGLIALSKAAFVKGTKGSHLDALARQHLWQHGCNFAHGTGHGVGHYLNVHEAPIRISPVCDYALDENMTISNEPGYYINNKYGIRLENLIYVTKADFENYFKFNTLTKVPFDINSINLDLLTVEEKEFLNNYHDEVYRDISPLLTEEEALFLKNLTRKI